MPVVKSSIPDLSAFPDPSAHYLLHRGGKTLSVKPLPDRLAVTLTPEGSIEPVIEQIERLVKLLGHEAVKVGQTIPTVGTEVWIPSGALEALVEQVQATRETLNILYLSPIYQLSHCPDSPIYLTNQLTILFAASTPAEQMKLIASQAGLKVFKLVPGIPKAFVFQVVPSLTAILDPLQLAHHLTHYPEVLLAEPNIVVSLRSTASLLAPLNPHPNQFELEAAWRLTQGNPSVVIAVAEAAIDVNQPVFHEGGRIVAPWLEANPAPKEESGQDSGVQRVARIAPECTVMPIALGFFLDDAMVERVSEWVIEQQASVWLCEWAASLEDYPLSLRQQAALTRAATKGRSGGCVIGFVVKNNNVVEENNDDDRLNGFALHPDVLTIADNPLAHQSNENYQTIRISVCAPRVREDEALTPGAIVAGIAALVRSANPDLTARQVKQLLQATADKVIASDSHLDRSAESGWIYDAYGYSQRFGYGQVNGCRAIEAALQMAQQSGEPTQTASLQWIEQQIADPLDIPDGDPQGVTTQIQIRDRRLICQIEISVEVEHSFMSDLEIYLIPPHQIPLLLQPRTAGRINILRKTYTLATTPHLKTLQHQTAQGIWQLQLIDPIPRHTGSLKRWSLRLGLSS